MRLLCFGGSFNPIHHGHLVGARAVAENAGFDRVLLIPTAYPPHKSPSVNIAPFQDRLRICQLATELDGLFDVSDIEGRRTDPSYTIDTARELVRQGFGKVHWLIGADMLLYLPKWDRVRELLQEVEFVIMARPGWTMDWDTLPPHFRHLQANVVESPLIEISASDIRRRVAAGLGIAYFTPEPVCRYIREHGLYREPTPRD